MPFGGSLAGMIASIKANKRTRVSTFEEIKDYKKKQKNRIILP
jgi:hypothetical protein